MKVKKVISKLLVASMVLSNTLAVGAFTNSCSGQWSTDTDVNYTYCSDGTLVIKGDSGTESLYSPCSDVLNEVDVKTVYISNVAEINPSLYIFNTDSYNIEYMYIDAVYVDGLINNGSTFAIKEVQFGTNVTTLCSDILTATDDLRITIPNNVTSIADDWLYGLGGSIPTIICEYGSEAYNWSLSKGSQVNIELMDITAQSEVTVDNTQTFEIIVPESIEFYKSNNGWEGDTYLGVVGEVTGEIKVTTDKQFKVVGEAIPSTETVTVDTEDSNTVENTLTLVTTISEDTLDNATDSIDVNGNSRQGYKIEYKCTVDSGKIMKQVYKGTVRYIISE